MEGIVLIEEERDILHDIHKADQAGLYEKSVAKAAKDLKDSNTKSVHADEWSQVDGLLCFRGKIYVPNDPSLRRRIVSHYHDTRVAGHPGHWKTLELVSRNYWWPHMSRYIGNYTQACDLCLHTKLQHQQPMGELQPLPIPAA